MKCNYCEHVKGIETLGVSGKYKAEWSFCEEHEMAAKIDRDNYLVEKIGKTYDQVGVPDDVKEWEKLQGAD